MATSNGSQAPDVLVKRLFAASLELHAALGTVQDDRTRTRIQSAVDDMDQAIREARRIAAGAMAAERGYGPAAGTSDVQADSEHDSRERIPTTRWKP